MKTMNISELITILEKTKEKHDDIPAVLFDNDRRAYFTLTSENIETQMMADSSKRVSIGINDYLDQSECFPAKRPL